MTKKKRSLDIMLGSFVALAMLVLLTLVFVIGSERRLFDSTVAVEAHFPNVAGLAVGADVMLAGVVIGHVSDIKFPRLRADRPGLSRDVTIVMQVSKGAMNWIREDSIARIDSKGLLGDKLINIDIGSPELPQMQQQGMLKSTPPIDFNEALQQAQEILGNVTNTVADVRDIFKGVVGEGGDKAFANSAKSIQNILKEVESGSGVLHQLIFDEDSGKEIKSVLKGLEGSVAKFEKLEDDMAEIFGGVKHGDGLINALLFDREGQKTVGQLNESLASMSELLREIKEGDGIAHNLIYTDDKGQFLQSLNIAGRDLQKIVADVKDGKGSLGLLLKDPSIYNELYGLIGNLRRNRLLKAIIRYGISKPDPSGGE